jgi:hypothetical protein
MRQQNTGVESNREPQIDTAIGFSVARRWQARTARDSPCSRSEQRQKQLFVLFRYSWAVTLMQKVHRLTHN